MDFCLLCSYQVVNGIVVLLVFGMLVSKICVFQFYFGMMGYNGIIVCLQQVISDFGVDGIFLDMDMLGGMVFGVFDCVDIIVCMCDIKFIWVLVNDMNCSVGQFIVSLVL